MRRLFCSLRPLLLLQLALADHFLVLGDFRLDVGAEARCRPAERIGAELTIRTVSLETRVDGGGGRGGAFYEALGAVRAEMAYSAWRGRLPCPGPVLAMIVGDCAISVAAVRYGMTARRARKLLIEALDAWPGCHAEARKRVDAGDLAAMHAGLM